MRGQLGWEIARGMARLGWLLLAVRIALGLMGQTGLAHDLKPAVDSLFITGLSAAVVTFVRGPDRSERNRRLTPQETISAYETGIRTGMLQAAMMQGTVTMQATRPPVRYALPGWVASTGPQPRVDHVIVADEWQDGVVTRSHIEARVGPKLIGGGGACGKCGQPMARHAYYGSGPCVIGCETSLTSARVTPRCEVCNMPVPDDGQVFIANAAYFCESCARKYHLP